MSLTSLLASNPNVKDLFSRIPNLKKSFKTFNDDGIAFPSKLEPIADSIEGANPSSVGTAYDYWLRAHIQRLNGDTKEQILVAEQAFRGLKFALYKYEQETPLDDKFNKSKEIRQQYIEGHNVDEKELFKACLFLAYCDSYFRAGFIRESGYDIVEAEILDLSQIARKTNEVNHFFKKQDHIIYNPTFGKMSQAVGGADADFIMDNMLVDIKTTKKIGYKVEYIRQLIGYYILSKFDTTFPVEINKLGIFYPRFNRFVYITIDDIRTVLNLDDFSSKFLKIVS